MEVWNKKREEIKNKLPCYEDLLIRYSEEREFTLEQMEVLTYVERYAPKDAPSKYIKIITTIMEQDEQDRKFASNVKKESTSSKRPSVKDSPFYRGIQELEAKHQEFGKFNNEFKKRVNRMLGILTDGKFSLKNCCERIESNSYKSFRVDKEEILFFMFLYLTYTSPDGKAFLKGDYHKVDEQYYNELRVGINLLIEKHASDIDINDINNRFDIEFGMMQREIRRQYQLLGHIVCEISEFKLSKSEFREDCQRCIEILEACNDDIMPIRNKLFPDDMTMEDIDAIINKRKQDMNNN